MSVITKGKTFANGEQLTAGKLNQMLDSAVFSSAAVDNTKTTLTGGAITIAPNAITPTEVAQSLFDVIYPVGSIYTNASDSTNPGTLLGFGTWVAFGAGRVPVGIDSSDTDFDTAEETGGAKTDTASITIPIANYGTTGGPPGTIGAGRMVVGSGISESAEVLESLRAGGGTQTKTSTIDVVQPYIVVYMWKRTV